jgi:hypothetical protein
MNEGKSKTGAIQSLKKDYPITTGDICLIADTTTDLRK